MRAFWKRIAERKKFADVLDNGAKTKEGFSNAQKGFNQVRVPKYTRFTHVIYRVIPDNGSNVGSSQIYPPPAVGKIGAAKELLDAVIGNRNLSAYE